MLVEADLVRTDRQTHTHKTTTVTLASACAPRVNNALVLYEVTTLVHYTPYSTGWGALIITKLFVPVSKLLTHKWLSVYKYDSS